MTLDDFKVLWALCPNAVASLLTPAEHAVLDGMQYREERIRALGPMFHNKGDSSGWDDVFVRQMYEIYTAREKANEQQQQAETTHCVREASNERDQQRGNLHGD